MASVAGTRGLFASEFSDGAEAPELKTAKLQRVSAGSGRNFFRYTPAPDPAPLDLHSPMTSRPARLTVPSLVLMAIAALALSAPGVPGAPGASPAYQDREDLAADDAPPAPVPPLPSERQLAWHEREYYAFVHFNMNTFTDMEWGHGTEHPDTFRPSELDCRQWARVCRDAGMRGIILTAKHHDGFCLWPSAFSEHTVAHCAWRGGKGDVVRELADACREYGLFLGLYLSPWDRNHPAYGDSPAYNAVFRGQLEEILTGYGDVAEVWFDGACGEGPNGKRQEYDWPSFVAVVREHQPGAVIFSDAGPDVRWVGNERGYGGETNWCLLRRDEFEPGTPRSDELTEGHEDGTHWVPAECNTSIRPSWYYHPEEDERVKSVEELLDIWHASIGRGGNLLLNLPVDRRGLVHENDVAALMELRSALDATYSTGLVAGASATSPDTRAGSDRFAPALVLDGVSDSYWSTDDGVPSGSLVIDLPQARLFDRVSLREYLPLGQRVRAFEVEVRQAGVWQPWVAGTTIGARRILIGDPVRSDGVRVRVHDAKAAPTLSEVELYLAPPRVTIQAASDVFLERMFVGLEANLPGAAIHFTLDGSEPTRESELYDERILLERSVLLRARAFLGEQSSWIAQRNFMARSKDSLRPPGTEAPGPAGIAYSYHEGGWQSLVDLDRSEPLRSGVTSGLELAIPTRNEHYAVVFEGWIDVPSDGIYDFATASDDGSRLWIGDELVVDNDGLHGLREVQGSIGLRAGWHALRVAYFNAVGGAELQVSWRGPTFARRRIAPEVLRQP